MPARRKPLPEELTKHSFTRAEAGRAGVGPGLLRGPSVQSMGRGVYLDASREPTLADRLVALLRVLPRGRTAVDGVTALRCWGIEVGTEAPYRFVTTVSYVSTRPDVRVRRARELPARRGPFLRPLPALVAARCDLTLVELVVAGDWIVRAKRATLAHVQEALLGATGRHCRRAHRAAELVRERVDSPQETRLRLMIVFAGLPEPECNIDLGDEWFFIGRVDLYLRAWNIAVEYEGDQHRTDPSVFADDLDRVAHLMASQVLVVRIAKIHMRTPRDVVHRVFTALTSRGYEGPPPHFGREWQEAFGR